MKTKTKGGKTQGWLLQLRLKALKTTVVVNEVTHSWSPTFHPLSCLSRGWRENRAISPQAMPRMKGFRQPPVGQAFFSNSSCSLDSVKKPLSSPRLCRHLVAFHNPASLPSCSRPDKLALQLWEGRITVSNSMVSKHVH